MLHLLFSKGADLGFIGSRESSARSVTKLAALSICWFAMNFRASLPSVARFATEEEGGTAADSIETSDMVLQPRQRTGNRRGKNGKEGVSKQSLALIP
ncbi:hypothetical protein F0562_022409 [Nyssa sinensis]|uniref:Uncharacterized protein n=1 Tax=Nyssa sinensis TaxID=561372 RepID=A0A5J5BRP3_9ASTE|nr:hypothetical protein F0562_022409 [Nyssa sinensis]